MSVTASRRAEVSGPSPTWLFLAARRAWTVLVAVVLLGALTAWFGAQTAMVPAAVEGGLAAIPLWRLLAMGAAVLPVLALHSRLADLEVVATQRLRRHQRTYLCAMSLGCATIYLGISATTLHPLVLVIMGRSWLAWWGVALVAGALLGWRLAWTLPAVMSVGFAYWGYHDGYRWWEFSARPHDDLPSLALSVGLLAAGLAAYAATPWRRRRLADRGSAIIRLRSGRPTASRRGRRGTGAVRGVDAGHRRPGTGCR